MLCLTLRMRFRAAAATLFGGAAIALVSSAHAGDAEFSVTLADGVVAPQSIVVPADTPLVLTVTNGGTSVAEFESKQLRIEEVVAPGATATLRIQPLPKGSYKFVEEFHEDQPGARGTIEVQ